MTTTSAVPPTSDPWPEAANYPPPEPPARDRGLYPPVSPAPASPGGRRTLPARAWRGRPEDSRWVRPAFLALLAATGLLYFWNLAASGWSNAFYSAAVQAGTRSWEAFFYGSSDAANFITVDKPPMSLWPMELAARVFGLNSWTVLGPEALMGVATVGVVYATVRRRFSALAGLLAGAVLALTPVAALMFRFNNPDALLVLLMALAAYGLVRAVETASTRWLLFVGVMFGFGFLTKTLQAVLILPAFAVIYLVVAPTGLGRRVRQVLLGGLAALVSAGWWVATVELVPANSRPYIGGSQDNDFLSVTFGYNGFGRITGNETGSVGGGMRPGGGGGGSMWGSTGAGRLFGTDIGGQIAWLLPAALALLVLGLWATRRYARTDTARAAFLVWGGTLLSTAVTFSFMSGIFHQYYTVALAPSIAALVGMGVDGLWRARHRLPYAAVLAVVVGGTAVWAYVLLGRSSGFQSWLRGAVLVGGLAAAGALLLASRASGALARRVATVGGLLALAAGLGGPAAYAVDTAATAHTGSIPTAGPRVAGGHGFGGPGGPGGFAGGQGGTKGGRFRGGTFPGGAPGGGFPGGAAQLPPGLRNLGGERGGSGGGFGGPGGGMGGLLDGAKVSSELADLLKQDAGKYTWVAAAVGSQNQASYQLATGEPVMALGGFNGTDPSLTLDQFKTYVQQGRVHYFIGGGGFGGGRGGSNSSSESEQIATWVSAHFTAKTVGSATVYDLTAPAS
ncbi:glycosyltransferase family 39 protein [Kitasatospora sp. NPDC002227]|uniref:ArnT family glycosyltransferase n=1 Tax=Kitasatospora sp. NPDC002227 TaxID=3154773 RepID=UPI0033288A7E